MAGRGCVFMGANIDPMAAAERGDADDRCRIAITEGLMGGLPVAELVQGPMFRLKLLTTTGQRAPTR